MEKILNILGAKKPFNNDGELTTDGANAYDKLIIILKELNLIGAVNKPIDEFERYFDEIINLGY
jgi:hypothetical protein